MMPRPEGARRATLETVIALFFLTWRLATYPFSTFYRDWVALLSLYWIITAWGQESKLWPWITSILVLWLMTIYSRNQLPFIIDGLRLLS